jgi:polysaccharide biosynthesis protein PslG
VYASRDLKNSRKTGTASIAPRAGPYTRPPMRTLSFLLAVTALLAAAAPAAAGERRVPHGWLGVVTDVPLRPDQTGEWDRMVRSGVESVRHAVIWERMQPYGSAAEVPAADAARFRDAGGVPTDFSGFDAVVVAAARRGLSVLPVVQTTPGWAAERPGDGTSPPRDPETFGRFLTALVGRYGPHGSLWAERPGLPRVPIRDWQVWNEPNITRYWSEQPFAPSYVRLLRVAHRALHAADRGATVVLAGLPNVSWRALRSIYRAGGRGQFDAVALHPYTRKPSDVLRLVRYARRVMRKRGDRRIPIWITELSWPGAKGKVPRPAGFEVSDHGQAVNLRRSLELLAGARRRQRIERVYWYTWLSTEAGPSSFDWSGLRRLRGGSPVSAPALAAFRRSARKLEGCAKASDARRCVSAPA